MNLVTRHVYAFEDIEVGMEASFARSVGKADVIAFDYITGDKNPVHLDARYAAKTIFKKPIAHGMLTAGYISAVFGMELPGLAHRSVKATVWLPRCASSSSIRPSGAYDSNAFVLSMTSRCWKARPC